MLAFFARLVSLPVILILLAFNLRRILFSLAVFFAPPRPVPGMPDAVLPTVLVLVPCRDEAQMIPGMGRALTRLDYPRERWRAVLIDDGSCDNTRAAMRALADHDARFSVLALVENVGKARALNAALAQHPYGEIVYVLDADHRPQFDALRRLNGYFADPCVGGVSGRTIALNALASPAAYYTALESEVNQMITMRAKDRLDLAPALLGSNCGYRRSALARCGGFTPGALLEDSDLTLRLCRAGYRLRFAPEARAFHQVPETSAGYLKQHTRWARGFNDVARTHLSGLLSQSEPRPLLRVELILFALGYLDRLALLGAAILSILGRLDHRIRFPRPVLAIALLTPFAQIATLLIEQRAPAAMWLRLPVVPLCFALDVLAALRATFDTLLNRARVWARTDRTGEHYS